MAERGSKALVLPVAMSSSNGPSRLIHRRRHVRVPFTYDPIVRRRGRHFGWVYRSRASRRRTGRSRLIRAVWSLFCLGATDTVSRAGREAEEANVKAGLVGCGWLATAGGRVDVGRSRQPRLASPMSRLFAILIVLAAIAISAFVSTLPRAAQNPRRCMIRSNNVSHEGRGSWTCQHPSSARAAARVAGR
jgi:hypothetical protein